MSLCDMKGRVTETSEGVITYMMPPFFFHHAILAHGVKGNYNYKGL